MRLFLPLLLSLGILMGSYVPDVGFDDMPLRAGLSNEMSGRAAPASVDTFTWVFENQWLSVSASSFYEASPDSLVKAVDGDLFRFGEIDQSSNGTTNISSSTSAMRTEPYRLPDGMPYGSMKAAFYYYPFTQIPSTAKILSATMYAAYNGLGETSMSSIENVKAVIDTSATNFSLVVAGMGSSASNSTVNWSYADVTGPTAWPSLPQSRSSIFDWGLPSVAVAPQSAIFLDGSISWWAVDLTVAVQKIVSDQLDDRLIWFLWEAWLEAGGQDWITRCGPSSGANSQQFVVVKWATEAEYDPRRFVICSDFHSNPSAFGRLNDALGDSLGSLMIHVGDAVLGVNPDTTGIDSCIVDAAIDSLGADYPLFLTFGNHEQAADSTISSGGVTTEIRDWMREHNKSQFLKLENHGGRLVNLGTKVGENYDQFISYSFDVGSAHIAVLNVQNSYSGMAEFEDEFERWLVSDLAVSKQPIKLVLSHYPLWRVPDEDTGDVNDYGGIVNPKFMWDKLDSLGVTAYICGHRHSRSEEKFGSMWHIQNPAMKWDTRQGFTVADVAENGNITLSSYRATGGGNGYPFEKVDSVTFGTTRTAATRDDGVWATGGSYFADGSTVEILGQGFGGAQGIVVISDAATVAGSTEFDLQTVVDWEDGWIKITVVNVNVNAGDPAYLHVICNGGSPLYEGWEIQLTASEL